MKNVASQNRASAQYARSIFEQLYKQKSVRLICAKLLAESIRLAHQVGPFSWSLTLYPDKIRLNSGPVEVLVLHLQPLSGISEEYEVDPIADLRPVCPNC